MFSTDLLNFGILILFFSKLWTLNSLLNLFIYSKNKVLLTKYYSVEEKTLVIKRAQIGTEFFGSRHVDIRCVLIVVDGE